MAAFGNKHGGPRDATTWTGVIGRESKKKSGKQGIHHHPLMSELGNGIASGLDAGMAKRKAGK